MSDQNVFRKTTDIIRNSVTVKVLSIGFLVLILLIPAAMVKSLIRERANRRNDVVREIGGKWGDAQTITGPVLTIPYKNYFKNSDGKTRYTVKNLHFLPKTLAITGNITPEVRYRGIYEAVLYNAKINLTGSFAFPDAAELNVDGSNLLWDRAFIALGITDMRGIKDHIDASLGGGKISVNPGVDTKDILNSGVSARIKIPAKARAIAFHFDINLNGSQQLKFVPVGKVTTVSLTSSWSTPSFTGAFLPVERTIDSKGFKADWRVLHLNRNYPQQWKDNKYKVAGSGFGVSLLVAADIYQKSTRTAKYAIMFIVFTFSAFFFSEVMNKRRLHPIQYLLIGFSLIIFYSLLISLSEHINFNLAYFVSAISVIALITGYTRSILNSRPLALTVFGILTMLYLYLYLVLQLEDYALLMGSLGLFSVLSAIMYMTRKINWYNLDFEEKTKQP